MTPHRHWLDTLPLKLRMVYDRAFGAQWCRTADKSTCRQTGRNAVEKHQREKQNA